MAEVKFPTAKFLSLENLAGIFSATKKYVDESIAAIPDLAPASASTLGGVKIAANSGLTVDASGSLTVNVGAGITKNATTGQLTAATKVSDLTNDSKFQTDTQVAATATKAANDAVTALVDGAPAALDTLKEIADFLKNDQVADGLVKQLATKANIADFQFAADTEVAAAAKTAFGFTD
jgi:hypothetical protein